MWDQSNRHYHHGMQAGGNTLNAHCARVLMRSLIAHDGCYDPDRFLAAYIKFMTADLPRHNDTYAESWHRGFFAYLVAGKPHRQCGAVTHDTPSMGGLVTLGPLAIHQFLQSQDEGQVSSTCRQHLFLTHPDETLARIAEGYVALLGDLPNSPPHEDPEPLLQRAARKTLDLDLESLARRTRFDGEIVGGQYSTACYITDSWPSLLLLAYKYLDDPKTALLTNTNLGGDNVHRGAVLAVIVSLACGITLEEWFEQLLESEAITEKIAGLRSLREIFLALWVGRRNRLGTCFDQDSIQHRPQIGKGIVS